jgi:hypothetical protein
MISVRHVIFLKMRLLILCLSIVEASVCLAQPIQYKVHLKIHGDPMIFSYVTSSTPTGSDSHRIDGSMPTNYEITQTLKASDTILLGGSGGLDGASFIIDTARKEFINLVITDGQNEWVPRGNEADWYTDTFLGIPFEKDSSGNLMTVPGYYPGHRKGESMYVQNHAGGVSEQGGWGKLDTVFDSVSIQVSPMLPSSVATDNLSSIAINSVDKYSIIIDVPEQYRTQNIDVIDIIGRTYTIPVAGRSQVRIPLSKDLSNMLLVRCGMTIKKIVF